MLALYEQGEPVDKLTVTEKLKQIGQLEAAGGAAAIEALAAAPPVVGNASQYGKIVKETAARPRPPHRHLPHPAAGRRARRQPASSCSTRPSARSSRSAHDDRRKDFRPIFEVLQTEIEKLAALSDAGAEITGTPSGFSDLDEITGGFQPGNLIILAARPSMGKCLNGSALVYDPWTGARRRHRRRRRGVRGWGVRDLGGCARSGLQTASRTGHSRTAKRRQVRVSPANQARSEGRGNATPIRC